MNACGLIVEYNPFHNGHLYHLQASKEKMKADVTVAVMSGNFLQRGEPAIIDKFSRTNAALQSGVDVVVELPHIFACQYADLFSKGAVATLTALGVDSLCFGSETGEIDPFLDGFKKWEKGKEQFQKTLKEGLQSGLSFPQASREAYQKLDLTNETFDLSQPNNILGFSYVKAIQELKSPINPETVKRTKSQYHDETIEHSIASATSIRQELFKDHQVTDLAKKALPQATINQLHHYQEENNRWHEWEIYFPYLLYLVKVTPVEMLRDIHGVIEGLEYRLRETAHQASHFSEWMSLLKTKRYTHTRLQRVFVHLLTQLKKSEMEQVPSISEAPYVRLLGMNQKGRQYINQQKKQMNVPLITNLQDLTHDFLTIEERAADAYYAPLNPEVAKRLRKQELSGPLLVE